MMVMQSEFVTLTGGSRDGVEYHRPDGVMWIVFPVTRPNDDGSDLVLAEDCCNAFTGAYQGERVITTTWNADEYSATVDFLFRDFDDAGA